MNKFLLLFSTILSGCMTISKTDINCTMGKKWIQYPIALHLDRNLVEKQSVIEAIEYWNSISVNKELFVIIDEDKIGNYDKRDNKNFITSSYDYNKTSDELAHTKRYYSDLIISEADIVINENYKNEIDTSTLIHELGHILGMNHNTENDRSIMFPYKKLNQRLTNEDIQELRCHNVWVKP